MPKRITRNPEAPPVDVGEETGDASSPRPDENVVEEIGDEVGVKFNDNEPIRPLEKMGERDMDRWEMDPASSADYQARQREMGEGEGEEEDDEDEDVLGDEEEDEDLELDEDELEDLDEDEELEDEDLEGVDEEDLEGEEEADEE